MTELEQVKLEIAGTEAEILRSWCELDRLDLPLEERAAKIATLEADNRLLAVLLTRLEELRRST